MNLYKILFAISLFCNILFAQPNDSIDVTDVNMLVILQPGEFKIYTTTKLPTPEPDLLTEIESEISETVPVNFELYQNYSNPFNPSTSIQYAVHNLLHQKFMIFLEMKSRL